MLFDKYTKIILTVIALALVSISLQIAKSGFIENAHALYGDHWHTIVDIQDFHLHSH